MTRKEWAKLSPDEQRIKVAELCGTDKQHIEFDPMRHARKGIPDYLNDLNAMHEAEGLLDEMQNRRYNQLLKGPYEASYPFHATAAQRAEAFVLTMEGE